ncbi:MAG TPA: threonine--tRNA ligase [Phycisphaerales bacterium]|nr:threonine--tRNA ligase [Phycisphaerales bacterium]
MPKIKLPDGSVREFASAVSALDVAKDIGPGLAKAAIGAKIDGVLSDLSAKIDHDAELSLITAMDRKTGQSSADALYLIRHSAAHVMAEAIQRIVPQAKLVYGPPVENGFYYDIWFPEDRPLRADDFSKIEEEMAKIIAEDRPFTRVEMPVGEGMAKLKDEGSKYKLDNAERAVQAGSEELSWYVTGEPRKNWEDLCRGPHVPSTGRIGAFKVMSLASSYWHGDEKSDRLTRVYGTAFADKAQLEKHMALAEEAKKRDHRVIGRALGLFEINETVGQGLILWTPAGAVIRQELQNFISSELSRQGYTQVFTPHVSKLDLFKTSGHFPYYKESQYPAFPERDTLEKVLAEGCSCAEMMHRLEGVSARLARTVNERTGTQAIAPDRVMPDEKLLEGYMLKPMNCPMHIKIFDSAPRSYRDMPVRLSEFGTVYRWEQSGELNGMTRVRGFTQDDAHIFCTEDQVPHELGMCLSLVRLIFDTLGMRNFRVRVGLRDPDSSKFAGKPEDWDRAEKILREAARTFGAPFTEEPGEAAFYGPKIDFVVKDVIGREWQLGTVQVDYNLPIRFGLSYIGSDNKPHVPIMIHRAPFGSMERFVGVLIEHFAGAFPVWLSPEQVRVLPISEKSMEYSKDVAADLKKRGVRVTVDESNDRIQGKIKVATDMKIPYLLVVGPRDAEQAQVSVRARGHMQDLGAIGRDAFADAIADEIASRGTVTVLARHFQNVTVGS